MGIGFRKGFRLGPLNINLSKSGIGFSLGTRGLRAGIDSKRRPYVTASYGMFRGRWGLREIQSAFNWLLDLFRQPHR